MMTKKIRLVLFFGGQSMEHAVSLESAKNVADALDAAKYDVHLIGIDRKGVWRFIENRETLRKTDVARPIDLETSGPAVFMVPSSKGVEILELETNKRLGQVDVAFPILHGPYGEDGTIQGYFRTLGLPYVGSGVLGSAVGMDKDVAKRLFRDAGLPIGNFLCLERHAQSTYHFSHISSELGLPFFLKPVNMGSSVGVHKVSNETEFKAALADAFLYDVKVLVEEFIPGREIECSVIGNHEVKASTPGEVLPQHDFYSYEAKYLDENGAKIKIPADLTAEQKTVVKALAIKVYQTLCCEGLSRVDFFLHKDGRFLVNEVNTIPGFTKISMYPKMWSQDGLAYSDLIDRLIELAFERHREEKSLKR
jgi:D-alanine-D-alanine ligase